MSPVEAGAPTATMKAKRRLILIGVIGGAALVSAAYCFWLMTVPLSYEWVYFVVGGFLLSVFVFVIASVTGSIVFIRWRRSHAMAHQPLPTTTRNL